jgi:hypothetical protein
MKVVVGRWLLVFHKSMRSKKDHFPSTFCARATRLRFSLRHAIKATPIATCISMRNVHFTVATIMVLLFSYNRLSRDFIGHESHRTCE